jgi:hypothetical protein
MLIFPTVPAKVPIKHTSIFLGLNPKIEDVWLFFNTNFAKKCNKKEVEEGSSRV